MRMSYRTSNCVFWQITAEQVCFWDMPNNKALVLAHERKAYPPRLILEVSGRNATQDDVLRVEFDGTKDKLSQEIRLTLPTQGR